MFTLSCSARRLPAVALLLGLLLVPLGTSAQELPSYAQPAVVSTDETIHGRIASVDGVFNISVDDDRGFVDNVELHQGTIINPIGLSLGPGMSVTISGYNAGSVFEANQIDTPYSYSGPLPTPVYYGAGYWCPGFAYGYGPSFSLAIIFGGFGGGFHHGYHFEHRPYHGRPWDGRRYIGSSGGHPYGGRELTGERRMTAPQGAGGERRTLPADVRGAITHGPAAFAGRSFAGRSFAGNSPRAFAGAQYSPGVVHYRAGGGGGYIRSAPAPNGFARGGVARTGGGGFARAGGGGFARAGGGGSAHGDGHR